MSLEEIRWWSLCNEFLDITLPKKRKRQMLREMRHLVSFVQ